MTTYYINFINGNDSNTGTKTSPWKRCPGMAGFSGSYSHTAGDTFIFKGGVTWNSTTLPLTINYSGTSTNIDTYSVDKTWYNGSSWTQPTFDMEQTNNEGISINTKSYIIIDNIKIINPHETSYGHRLLYIDSSNNITIQSSTLDGSNGLNDSTPIEIINSENIIIDGNYIRGKQVSGNPDCILIRPWYKIKNIIIRNNEITHPYGNGGDGIHIDAEIPAYDIDPSNSAFYNDFAGNYGPILIESNNFHDMAGKMFISALAGAHNITIRYNIFHGQQNDRVAIDFDGAANGAPYYYDTCKIYYNEFYKIIGDIVNWGGIIRIVNPDKSGSQNNIIYNNIIVQNNDHPNYEIGIYFYNNVNGNTWFVKYNILYGLTNGISGGSPTNISNNLFYNNQNNGTTGTNPIIADPKFVNPSNNDFHLQSNSPAIDKAIDWGQTRDFDGNPKQGVSWDIGAYEYITTTCPTPIVSFTMNII